MAGRDGDSARQALSTTIHRLRRLIGYEQTLQRQGGKLSLDQRCWTDVWIFERLLAGSESAISHRQKDKRRWTEILESTEKALALYQGSFLSGDDEVPWAVAFGERLRRQWIRRLGELGERCESPRECQKAVDCYEKAAEIQPERKNFTAALWSSTAASGVGPRLSKLTGAAARSRSRNSAVSLALKRKRFANRFGTAAANPQDLAHPLDSRPTTSIISAYFAESVHDLQFPVCNNPRPKLNMRAYLKTIRFCACISHEY